MCGGGKNKQTQAADKSTALSDTMGNIATQNAAQVNPFYSKQMNEGLPFFNAMTDYSGGQMAQAYAPARAQLEQRLSRMGNTGLPSGFATQARTGLDAGQARSFDDSMIRNLMLQQQAKEQGAQGLNPMGYFGGAQQGYGSIMQMPQKPSMLGSVLGGALGGAMKMAPV